MSRGAGLLYLDSSALVKLVVPEAETSALLDALDGWPHWVSSELALVEVSRAVLRVTDDPETRRRMLEVLASVDYVPLAREVLQQAGSLSPTTLRSLDAIHLASALFLGAELKAFTVYDRTLADAARAHGLVVIAPA